jgi:hypothetical protein
MSPLQISYVLRELNEREELRKFVGVEDVPDAESFYSLMSRFSENQFVKLINGVLNTQNPSKRRRNATILVDSTDLQVNWNRKKRSKKSWKMKSLNGVAVLLRDFILDIIFRIP